MAESRSTATAAKRAAGAVTFILASLVSILPAVAVEDCASHPVEIATVEEDATIRLRDGLAVQLSGIEVPRDPANAAALRIRISELLAGGGVSLRGQGTPDRYNLVHAMVMLRDGQSLQWQVVADGRARVRFVPGEAYCGDNLLAAEEAARKAHLGLWSGHEYAISAADESSLLEQIGLYALVEGRVVSVSAGSRIVFLDFGHNWRRDFTVMVAASDADRFAAAGKKLESLANRFIRVRGVIEVNNGPAIRVDNPDAIELVDGD